MGKTYFSVAGGEITWVEDARVLTVDGPCFSVAGVEITWVEDAYVLTVDGQYHDESRNLVSLRAEAIELAARQAEAARDASYQEGTLPGRVRALRTAAAIYRQIGADGIAGLIERTCVEMERDFRLQPGQVDLRSLRTARKCGQGCKPQRWSVDAARSAYLARRRSERLAARFSLATA